MIACHELGHLALGHVKDDGPKAPSGIVLRAFTRQQEIDADHYGMDLTLKANFTRAGVMRNWLDSDRLGPGYTSYEGGPAGKQERERSSRRFAFHPRRARISRSPASGQSQSEGIRECVPTVAFVET